MSSVETQKTQSHEETLNEVYEKFRSNPDKISLDELDELVNKSVESFTHVHKRLEATEESVTERFSKLDDVLKSKDPTVTAAEKANII